MVSCQLMYRLLQFLGFHGFLDFIAFLEFYYITLRAIYEPTSFLAWRSPSLMLRKAILLLWRCCLHRILLYPWDIVSPWSIDSTLAQPALPLSFSLLWANFLHSFVRSTSKHSTQSTSNDKVNIDNSFNLLHMTNSWSTLKKGYLYEILE